MTCIIIEDQPPAQRILTKYIGDTEGLTLKATFPDALSALAFLETTAVDLIFLDLHLPQMSGFDFFKKYRATTGGCAHHRVSRLRFGKLRI